MARKKSKSGFNARWRRFRARVSESAEALSRAVTLAGVEWSASTARSWENDDKDVTGRTLVRVLKAIRGPDGESLRSRGDLLEWLLLGEDEPPRWVSDTTASAFGSESDDAGPSGPGGSLVAMPNEALAAGREAFRILDGARAIGDLRDRAGNKAWNVLETAFSGDPQPSQPALAAGLSPKEIFFDRLHAKRSKDSRAS